MDSEVSVPQRADPGQGGWELREEFGEVGYKAVIAVAANPGEMTGFRIFPDVGGGGLRQARLDFGRRILKRRGIGGSW